MEGLLSVPGSNQIAEPVFINLTDVDFRQPGQNIGPDVLPPDVPHIPALGLDPARASSFGFQAAGRYRPGNEMDVHSEAFGEGRGAHSFKILQHPHPLALQYDPDHGPIESMAIQLFLDALRAEMSV